MGSDNGFLKLQEDVLRELSDYQARKTVGKVCKRFEIHDNPKILKEEVKELLYESFRDYLDLLIASGKGLQITQFQFKGKSLSA
jgi:hypothetical protein